MRLIIVLSACVALTSSKSFKYTGPLNLNTKLVEHPNGAKVPADEPAVASARAAHLTSKAAPASVAADVPISTSDLKYTGPLNLNTITSFVDHPNGAMVPADEPAVASARAAHLSSKAAIAASAPTGAGATFAAGGYKSGAFNLDTRLVDFPNGAKVPVDEPAVASARAAHLSSKSAIAGSVPVAADVPISTSDLKYTGPLNLNTITRLVDHPNGAKVPADEPAVASARAAHLSSKAATAVSYPVGAASPFSESSGAFNLNFKLVDFPNGAVVPEYEPVVAAVRSSHLKAKAAISTDSIGVGY